MGNKAGKDMTSPSDEAPVRLDSWLWAARFFKTRSLARQAVDGGKVDVNGERGKASKLISPGVKLVVRKGEDAIELTVVALAKRRGPASVAQGLYQESDASIERRQARQSEARLLRLGLSAPAGRPDKRDRRARASLRSQADPSDPTSN